MDLLIHYARIVLLGVIERVTEFLPISSTGHLLLAEGLGLGHEPDVFNVVIQAGAILAVFLIYWDKIISLIEHLNCAEARDYVLKILLAFAITGVLGLFFTEFLHIKLPDTITPVAWAVYCVLFGWALLVALSTHALPEIRKAATQPIPQDVQKEMAPLVSIAAAATTNVDTAARPTDIPPVIPVANVSGASIPWIESSSDPAHAPSTNLPPAHVPASQ